MLQEAFNAESLGTLIITLPCLKVRYALIPTRHHGVLECQTRDDL